MRLWALVCVLVVSALVRLFSLGWESYWFDEIWAVNQVRQPLSAVIDSLINEDVHPPLYPVLLWQWVRWFGEAEATTRLMSALFGWAAVPTIYWVGRELYDRRTGVIAAAFLGLNAFAVFYSQETRAYSLVLFLSTLATGLLITKRWWSYVLVGALLAYAHNYGLFLLLSHGIYVLFFRPDIRKPLLWSALAILVAYTPWIPSVIGQVTRVQSDFWIAPLSFVDPIKWIWYWTGYNIPVAIVSIGLAVYGALEQKSPRSLLLLWLSVPILVPVMLSLVAQPIFHHKYVIMILAALSLLVARGLLRLNGRFRQVTAVALLACMIVGLPYALWTKPSKEQWRELAQAAKKAHTSGDTLIADAYNKPYLPYYLKDTPVVWVNDLSDVSTLEGNAAHVVLLQVHPPRSALEAQLDKRWERVGETQFHRARVARYRVTEQRQRP